MRWLAVGGDEAIYVDDVLTPPAADNVIWNLAAEKDFIVVSKDADFATRAAREDSVRVVWIRCGNLKLDVFEAWFAVRIEAMRRLIALDERVIELR